LEVEYFGPRALTEDNSVRSSATTEVNGQFGYRLTDNFRLQANGFNLLNSRDAQIAYYYRSRLRGEPLAGVDDIHFHPLESRSFRLTAIYNF
jgi:hypothetical protein